MRPFVLTLLGFALAVMLAACASGSGSVTRSAAASAASPARVELDVFSGRPNPMWELSAADTAALLDVIAALPPTSPLDLPMPLGYRGFLVSLTAPESGTEMVIHAFQGTVESRGDGTTYYADPGRQVERWLLATSRPHLEGGLYNSLLAEIGEQ
jgi:hypothetical protein